MSSKDLRFRYNQIVPVAFGLVALGIVVSVSRSSAICDACPVCAPRDPCPPCIAERYVSGSSGSQAVVAEGQKPDRWPSSMTHDVSVNKISSTNIGTKQVSVVEVEHIPAFVFEKGTGNGFPQDERYWRHHTFLQPAHTYKPAQLNQEIALVLSYLHPEGIMLEWGSGGSTVFYSPHVKQYFAVEHNANWARLVQNTCKDNGLDNVQVHHVAADHTRSEGGTREGDFTSYCNEVQSLGVKRFDFVLIDGRARQFCAKSVLPYVDEHSRIFVHDFPLRERYFSVFDDFFVVASVLENGAKEKGLVVLQPRQRGV